MRYIKTNLTFSGTREAYALRQVTEKKRKEHGSEPAGSFAAAEKGNVDAGPVLLPTVKPAC
jgi:hypothetical protein